MLAIMFIVLAVANVFLWAAARVFVNNPNEWSK